MKSRNASEQSRVSGLMGMLNPSETTVAMALLAGRNPAKALAEVRGKDVPGQLEARDVRECMASERVRRTLAGVTGVRPGEVRQYVVERLVTEAEDAREGGTRVRALELLGNIPGVDVWKPKDDRDESLADAGLRLGEVLSAVADRLSSEVLDVASVHIEPDFDVALAGDVASPIPAGSIDLSDPFEEGPGA